MPFKLLTGSCSTCKRKKTKTVSHQTIAADGLGDVFTHIGSAGKNVGKKVLNKPGTTLEFAAKIRTAAASKIQNLLQQRA